MQQQRALLDQLLGSNRDIHPSVSSQRKRNFYDEDVCKYYLSGLCPYHELFKNTKSDLGPCHYLLHDETLRDEYYNLSDNEKHKYGYERDTLMKLHELLRDMDRKIMKNKLRANEENAPKPLTEESQRMVQDMGEHIKRLISSSQKLGEEGNVDHSLQKAQEAENMKIEKENLEQRLKYPGGRIMFVCEVCGVFINSTDNEARRADHYNGKQYLGWKAIRDKLKALECTMLCKTRSPTSRKPVTQNKSMEKTFKECTLRKESRQKHDKQRSQTPIRRARMRSPTNNSIMSCHNGWAHHSRSDETLHEKRARARK